ncbi:Brp/Blh family beta-carotene 15,15'-dioxygenase [Salinibaculum rarum]|uniref:Brp/Blh family beta-carotene 15,15'-dioxygenase n=1 Tax=Salinibaculum rarum TaxID=3058903 RepID=UPI00265E4B40|nr:Brp/Blh family beta-carotene 15,15'-dioxygenase [Salinibaculum sp. KK48]
MGIETVDDQTARAALGKAAALVGWLPLAALVPLSLLVGELSPTVRYLPLVASVVVFGMPHGAVDYVALPRARTGHVDLRGVFDVSVLYLVAGLAYLALWFLFPVVAATFFIALTWFHWGQGDLYALRDLFRTDHIDDFPQQALTVVVRGGLPMLVPLIGFPATYRTVVDTFVEPFGGSTAAWWLFDAKPRLALAGIFGTITIIALARGFARARDRRRWRLDAAETTFLWVFFLAVPPILAVGTYFCLWHSVRHIARVVLLDERSVADLAGWRWLPPLGRFTLEAAVPTVIALAFIGGLWWGTGGTVETLSGATGLYLVGIAVLTLPHTVVVTILDREQHIWSWPDD